MQLATELVTDVHRAEVHTSPPELFVWCANGHNTPIASAASEVLADGEQASLTQVLTATYILQHKLQVIAHVLLGQAPRRFHC